MKRLHSIDGGYVYEVDGALYFMDRNFQETSLLCDLCQLMGDLYSFSPETVKTCDLTEDALRMLACTDEGLYEYQLESGERKLLEPAFLLVMKLPLRRATARAARVISNFPVLSWRHMRPMDKTTLF